MRNFNRVSAVAASVLTLAAGAAAVEGVFSSGTDNSETPAELGLLNNPGIQECREITKRFGGECESVSMYPLPGFYTISRAKGATTVTEHNYLAGSR